MSFVSRHFSASAAGGVPLPSTADGNAYDTAARVMPGVFTDTLCPGTGNPASTYPKTVYMRSINAIYYRLNINGAGYGARMDVPGAPVTGTFDWQLILDLATTGTSMQSRTLTTVQMLLTSVGDVIAIGHTINFTLAIERCARPVGLTINGCSYNGCDTDRCNVSWSSTAANVASSTFIGISVQPTSFAIVASDPGSKAYNWQSISGVAADSQTGSVDVTRTYSTDCSTGNPACPRGLDCFGVCGGTAMRDCAGTCGGSAVRDCADVCNGSAVRDCADVCNGGAMLLPCPVGCGEYCSALGTGGCPTSCPCTGGGTSSYVYQCIGGTWHITGGSDPPGCSSSCTTVSCYSSSFNMTFPIPCPSVAPGDTLLPCTAPTNQNTQNCS